jgi:uncharacterized protein with PQ loop repeat
MQLSDVLAPVCTALSVGLIWPQVWRVYRLRTVEGLAPIGTLHGLTACTLWTMYGVARSVAPLIVSNGAIGAAMLLLAAAQIRHRALRVRDVAAVLAVTVSVGTAALAVSTTLGGTLAVVVGVTSIVPQTIHAARVADLSAISLPTYGLICASGFLWGTYGALIGDGVVIVTNVLILPCAMFIAVMAWRSRRLPLAPSLDAI